jgi:hypothetical protein
LEIPSPKGLSADVIFWRKEYQKGREKVGNCKIEKKKGERKRENGNKKGKINAK